MWWPRPRWKSDFLARFVLLIFILVATTTNTVMADEGQHCGGSDMSAVIWTTALCTMLLVLIVVVIYFVYCKKREHVWSSLWWKSTSDKNIVLQTSPPTNGQQQKIGGTDNPAFLADSYVVGRVTKTGLNKIVHVSSLNDGSLGAELSIKEEDGRKIFMCKHNDGSKDRLVAVRLVFDKGQQQRCGPSSDLSRALAELSREYGLQVELETEGDAVAVSGENGGVPEKRVTRRPDVLSAVRGTALRLWQQRPLVFKGGDGGGRADDKTKGDGDDVESGRVADAPVRSEQRKPVTCSAVTTVNETATATVVAPSPQQQHPQQQLQQQQQTTPLQSNSNCNGGVGVGSRQYRTLEYGASPADATARSSPDSSIQCCVVNSSGPAAKADDGRADGGEDGDADAEKKVCGQPTTEACGEPKSTSEPGARDDDGPKHGNPPPPPPPRKYSASVHVPAAVAAEPVVATVVTAHVDDPLPVVSVAPAKAAPPTTADHEIRIDDDYYWCTTTAMATPPMSTFGKRPSVTAATLGGDDETPQGPVASTVRGDADDKSAAAVDKSAAAVDKSAAAADESGVLARVQDDRHDGGDRVKSSATAPDDVRTDEDDAIASDVDGVRGDMAAVDGGGTTSIEDASLPSFSSDEEDEEDDDDDDDDDDVGETTGNAQFSCGPAVTADRKDAEQSSAALAGDDGGGRKGGRSKPDAKAECNGVAPAADSKSPTKLPTLRLSLSSPLQSSAAAATSCCSSSASSTSSTSPSPTNNGNSNNNNNNSPIVSKIPVRRQSAGSSSSSVISNGGGTAVSMSLANNGSAKKSIPLPLSRSGSRLAMWSSVN